VGIEIVEGADRGVAHRAALGRVGIDVVEMAEIGAVFEVAEQRQGVALGDALGGLGGLGGGSEREERDQRDGGGTHSGSSQDQRPGSLVESGRRGSTMQIRTYSTAAGQ